MRISNFTMARNYINNLNTNQAKLYAANMKVESRRRFSSVDEDVSRALKSFRVRQDLEKNAAYRANIQNCESFLAAAEDNARHIVDLGNLIAGEYTAAMSGDKTGSREPYKATFEKLQKEILTTLNADFAGKYAFGGTQIDKAPFDVDVDGFLTYKGVKVADIDQTDPQYDHLFEDQSFIDIGLGFSLDASGKVIESTAFDRSIVGLSVSGFGPDNIYDLLTRTINEMDSDTPDPELLNKLRSATEFTGLEITRFGTNSTYLSFTKDRLESEALNLTTRQDSLEFVDYDEAILDFKMQEVIYNASLQMGTRLLQPSLFNFLN